MNEKADFNRSLTNSQIYDGEFFEIVGNEGDILVVRCNICTPDGTDGQFLRTSVKSNGNILKHIKRRHLELLEKIKAAKSVKSRAPRAIKRGASTMDDSRSFKKKVVQVKIKKQNDDEIEEHESQVFISEEIDSYNGGNEMYVIEPCESTESDVEDYVEFELDQSKADERSVESAGENSLLTPSDYEYKTRKQLTKRRGDTITYDGSPSYKRTPVDRSLLEFQKKLMQAEFDDIKKLRHEKHQLEIAILKADLTHKTLEHQKQMELLNQKIQD